MIALLGLLVACTSPVQPAADADEASQPKPDEAPLVATAPKTANLKTYTHMWEDLQIPRSSKDGKGTAQWLAEAPSPTVGSIVDLSVRFVVGPEGIDPKGTIFAAPEAFWGWSPPQTESPESAGFVRFEGPENLTAKSGGGWAWAEVGEGGLAAGDEVIIHYRGRADRYAGTAWFWVGVDGDGDGVRKPLAKVPSLIVQGEAAAQIHLVLPSTRTPGTAAKLRVSTLDALGNTATAGERTIELQGMDSVPPNVHLKDGECCAVVAVPDLKAGVHRVRARFDERTFMSNPMVVAPNVEPILWADLQIHTGQSDGTGSVGEAFHYAENVAGLDVAAITDHDHWGRVFLDESGVYLDSQIEAIQRRNAEFLPLVGYEWTSWVYGHRHIVDFGGTAPLASSMDAEADTPAELRTWQAGGGKRLIIPHHIAGGPVAVALDADRDPSLEPVLEVVSVHGQSVALGPDAVERAAAGHFAVDWLNAGHRVGFIGSTDGHDGHPGLSQLGSGKGGLAAILTDDLDGVHGAISNRRTYATNGSRIILRTKVDGVNMGGVVPTSESWTISTKGVGTDIVSAVLLHSSEGIVASGRPNSVVFNEEWQVPPASWYFVEIQQVDGGRAWSSPVTRL